MNITSLDLSLISKICWAAAGIYLLYTLTILAKTGMNAVHVLEGIAAKAEHLSENAERLSGKLNVVAQKFSKPLKLLQASLPALALFLSFSNNYKLDELDGIPGMKSSMKKTIAEKRRESQIVKIVKKQLKL
ncbi:MAG: hypothetical protein HUJ57_08335 [Erysipelotrichaceae bacterium]|nr:hypothetical protein [Erysipelotrichaceae bacterium]